MYQQLTLTSILGLMAYVVIIWLVLSYVTNRKYHGDRNLRFYFNTGLFLKLAAGIAFGLLYEFHYKWAGDTFYYFRNACRLANTFWESPLSYFKILFDWVDESNVGSIDISNYNPIVYWDNRSGIYAIHRFVSVFAIMGFNNYYIISVLMNTFLFVLNWKLFRFIIEQFPKYRQIAFISFLCVPSVLLFGSGIMKDSFTLSFSGIILISMYRLLFEHKFNLKYIFMLLISLYVVFQLKPYIVYSFVISVLAWWGLYNIQHVKNKVLRIMVFPIIIVVSAVVIMYVFSVMGNLAGGRYSSVESMVTSASMSQYDLRQDYYEGESFDIGSYTDISGAIMLMPKAIVASWYRPYIWEAHSFAMMISGMENLIMLLLSLYALFRVRPFTCLNTITKNMFLVFALILSLIMAIGIGLSTSNFSALVRFRIPLVPYFLFLTLYVIWEHRKQVKEKQA